MVAAKAMKAKAMKKAMTAMKAKATKKAMKANAMKTAMKAKAVARAPAMKVMNAVAHTPAECRAVLLSVESVRLLRLGIEGVEQRLFEDAVHPTHFWVK